MTLDGDNNNNGSNALINTRRADLYRRTRAILVTDMRRQFTVNNVTITKSTTQQHTIGTAAVVVTIDGTRPGGGGGTPVVVHCGGGGGGFVRGVLVRPRCARLCVRSRIL